MPSHTMPIACKCMCIWEEIVCVMILTLFPHRLCVRSYGAIQLPHLLANWKQIWREETHFHNIWVCEK